MLWNRRDNVSVCVKEIINYSAGIGCLISLVGRAEFAIASAAHHTYNQLTRVNILRFAMLQNGCS